MKVAIIGGGVIGLSLAWELSNRGHQITLIDRGPLGKKASWAGAGILLPGNAATAIHPMEHLEAHSNDLHESWAARLIQQTGIDNGYPQMRRDICRHQRRRSCHRHRIVGLLGRAFDCRRKHESRIIRGAISVAESSNEIHAVCCCLGSRRSTDLQPVAS